MSVPISFEAYMVCNKKAVCENENLGAYLWIRESILPAGNPERVQGVAINKPQGCTNCNGVDRQRERTESRKPIEHCCICAERGNRPGIVFSTLRRQYKPLNSDWTGFD